MTEVAEQEPVDCTSSAEIARWVPDEARSQCFVCTKKFTALRRKHHCRACGEVVCKSCLSIGTCPGYPKDKPQRVCHKCTPPVAKPKRRSVFTTKGTLTANDLSSQDQDQDNDVQEDEHDEPVQDRIFHLTKRKDKAKAELRNRKLTKEQREELEAELADCRQQLQDVVSGFVTRRSSHVACPPKKESGNEEVKANDSPTKHNRGSSKIPQKELKFKKEGNVLKLRFFPSQKWQWRWIAVSEEDKLLMKDQETSSKTKRVLPLDDVEVKPSDECCEVDGVTYTRFTVSVDTQTYELASVFPHVQQWVELFSSYQGTNFAIGQQCSAPWSDGQYSLATVQSFNEDKTTATVAFDEHEGKTLDVLCRQLFKYREVKEEGDSKMKKILEKAKSIIDAKTGPIDLDEEVKVERPIGKMEGFMKKQGNLNKSYKVRHFRLLGSGSCYSLQYFKTVQSTKPLGVIPVTNATKIESFTGSENAGAGCLFGITPPSARTYILAAPDQQAYDNWMAALSQVVQGYKASEMSWTQALLMLYPPAELTEKELVAILKEQGKECDDIPKHELVAMVSELKQGKMEAPIEKEGGAPRRRRTTFVKPSIPLMAPFEVEDTCWAPWSDGNYYLARVDGQVEGEDQDEQDGEGLEENSYYITFIEYDESFIALRSQMRTTEEGPPVFTEEVHGETAAVDDSDEDDVAEVYGEGEAQEIGNEEIEQVEEEAPGKPIESIEIGQECLAKWSDGHFYDAVVEVLGTETEGNVGQVSVLFAGFDEKAWVNAASLRQK